MSEAQVISQTGQNPVTVATLVADLAALGLRPGMVVLAHTALSRLGWVCGGPVAVIQALETVLGPEGTLVMPAHSGNLSDPSYWVNPPVPESWWPIIRDTMPAYDPDLTPTFGIGVTAECFRKQAGVLRSGHPSVSFAARGKHAVAITSHHALDYCLGDQSPLARLYELDAWVLLLGVGHGSNTSLHLAEYRASYPGKTIVQQGAPVQSEGGRRWVSYADVDWDADDFCQIGDAFESTGHIQRGPVGYGEARLMRQRPLVDFAVEWMAAHRRLQS